MKVYSCDCTFSHSTLVTSSSSLVKSLSSTEKFTYFVDESREVTAFNKSNKPFSLNLSFKVKALSCGREHIALLADDLSVYTWGNGESGALGLSSTESYSTPQKISLSSDFHVSSVVCGGWHTLILARYLAGKNFLLATGRNSEGQLGTGRLNRELFPVKVEIQEEIKDLKAGNNFSMILSESKSVYMSGDNRFGQLGIGHKRNIFTFERVPIDNVDKIACGNHSAAISNGRLYVWGTCSFGEFIRPTVLHGVSSPDQIFVGDSVGVALDAEGCLWNWGGKNSEGRLKKSDLKADLISLASGSYILALQPVQEFARKKERSNTSSFHSINKNELLSPAVQKKRSFFGEQSSETPKYNPSYRGFREASSEKKPSEQETNEKILYIKEENEKLLSSSQGLTSRLNEKLQENHELSQKISELQQVLRNKDEILNKTLEKTGILKAEREVLQIEIERLKDSNKKLNIEHEILSKNFISDSEIKQYYEKYLNELEEIRTKDRKEMIKEIESLTKENDSIQSLLADLREENNHLRLNQEAIEQKYLISQSDLKHAAEIRNQLEEKIISLQSRLNDLTSANNNLYISLEKEISHKTDLVSLAQLSKHLEVNHESPSAALNSANPNHSLNSNNEFYENFKHNVSKSNETPKQRFIQFRNLDEDKDKDFVTNRKGLSATHQERLMKVAAEKLKIEDLDYELHSLSSSSPVHVLPSPARGHKKSFEDVRNTIMNLKKKRSFLHKEPKFSSSSFRK